MLFRSNDTATTEIYTPRHTLSLHDALPTSLAAARELFAGSQIAREAFGEDVVAHYVNAADVELAAFGSAVTDWERYRGFERL